MKVKHLIAVKDLKPGEIREILQLASLIKKNPLGYGSYLHGKSLALIFEKPSTRTWASFHAGIHELGGACFYLGPDDMQLGGREPVRDVARVLSRYFAGFVLRTYSHETIVEFAKYAVKPVINGLSDLSHPCQALTDLFTIGESFNGNLKDKKIAYVGDGNNVLNSLGVLFAKMGLRFYYATPKKYAPRKDVVKLIRDLAVHSRATVEACHNPAAAVKDADVVYTDVWVSMGQEKEARDKKKHFQGFQVNSKLLAGAKKEVRVMHCLPAHRGEEITDRVIESSRSLVFEQAGNRLPVQKAILIHLLG